MKLSEHKALKTEILNLPTKEKDRLLLRLIAKDKILTEHLHFLLMENEQDLSDRVLAIKQKITVELDLLLSENKINAKEITLILRKLIKLVNHNFKVTKSNFEDVDLRIFLFTKVPVNFKFRIFSSTRDFEHAFGNYYLKSVIVAVNKYNKLHEDLQFDLKEDLNLLLDKIYRSDFKKDAVYLGLPTKL